MAVLSCYSFTLEVPDLEAGIRFYTDAGLVAARDGDTATLHCVGHERESITLLGGYPEKRLHHIALRAEALDEISARVVEHGGAIIAAPAAFADEGLRLNDPHIGSNFFQDPWGSWFEYYSDMDYIDDHTPWTPTNYEMQDSLASWGPAVPHDFVHNREFGPLADAAA